MNGKRTERAVEARLLVVEDDANIVELLSASLRYAGFEVATAVDGHLALRAAREVRPDLVLLDVMIPGIDGFEVVRRMRSEGLRCPVLFLTARDSTDDKITGLTIGGDDYVTKPFSLDEVLARIRVILRRGAGGPATAQAARMSFADIELDDETHEVWKAGEAVTLSPTEFNLLRYFMQNPGRVLSKPQILDHVWHYDFGGDANVVESYVSYLRRKMDTTEPRLLQTLRGVGYMLRAAPGLRVMPAAPSSPTTRPRALGWLPRLWAPKPLRVKLVATVVLLVLVALTGSGAAGIATLRSYLTGRVDSQLRAVADHPGNDVPIAGSNSQQGGGNGGGSADAGSNGGDGHRLPSAFVVEVASGSGAVVYGPTSDLIDASEPLPQLPRLSAAPPTAQGSHVVTVRAISGDEQWRVLVKPVTLTDGSKGTLLVAQSLGDVRGTVGRLTLLLAIIGAVAVLVIAAVGYGIVRVSLRPLRQVEHTAAAIAAGDLTQRVPQADAKTEVGQLSAALNTMLGEIETAFAQRAESEAAARQSEERMRLSEGAARQSEQRMRRFIADASHELRTPLTSIRGFSELYRQGAASTESDIRRLMARIEGEAKRMGLLVEDLLMLARLDQQRPLAQRPVDLLAVAADVVHDARTVNPTRAIRLEVGASDPPPIVTGDEPRLRQVLANLMANAVQHTPTATPVTVRVETEVGDLGGAHSVVLTVADHGPGMTRDDADRVFERFYRTDQSRSRNDGGSGLGLSIVAALVAGHGGTVTVETAPGSGATFRIELPLADAPVTAPDS